LTYALALTRFPAHNQRSGAASSPPPSGPRPDRSGAGAAGVPKIDARRPWARGPGYALAARGLSREAARFCSPTRGVLPIQDSTKRVRVNRQIRISPIRVIGADGSQLGILEVDRALAIAEEQGLDLVEVAPMARPPVARIMDYGKFKFEQAKQARQAKKKQHVIQLKEVKFRPGIDEHDFETKTRHARRFLEEGNKVKVTLMFRGRQISHPELGRQVVDRVALELQDLAKIEADARLEGKAMTMILTPK
jgi:translation initiation factor IF-3